MFDSVPPEIVMDLRPESRMMSVTFLYLLIHIIGSLETSADLICAREFETKTLIWPEKSTDKTHHVESRSWYKNETYVSSIHGNIFRKGPGYEDRLKHVGDGNIEIKRVTRNDSGNYKRTSKFSGVNDLLHAFVNLQVIDAPAADCKPVIFHEGSNLKADLPSVDVCTTSQLKLEWIGTNKTVTTQNGTTILDLGTDSGEREYMVCAVGEATKCFQGNMSDFCTNYTVPQHQQSGDEVTIHLAVTLPIALLVIAILAIGGIFWMRHKGIICQKSSQTINEDLELGSPLTPGTVQTINEDPESVLPLTPGTAQTINEDPDSVLPSLQALGHDYDAPIRAEHMTQARLYIAVVTVCTNALRDILLTTCPVPYADIYQVILANRQKLTMRPGRPLLNNTQSQLLFPDPHGNRVGTLDQFDISLLYILIRNISTVPPPVTGWGYDPLDHPRDCSLGASVERIRSYRNHIIGHFSEMNQYDLNDYWNKIDDVLDDIEQALGRQGFRAQLEKQMRPVISVYEAC